MKEVEMLFPLRLGGPRRCGLPLFFALLVWAILLALQGIGAQGTHAASNLGIANDYNVFILGNDAQSGTDSEGRVAVGGNATFSSYSAAGKLGSGSGINVVVGGMLETTYGTIQGSLAAGSVKLHDPTISGNVIGIGSVALDQNGTVSGSVFYGTTYSNNPGSKVTVSGPVSQQSSSLPFSFSTASAQLQSLSSACQNLTVNGATVISYGSITLTGTNATLNVFAVNGSDLANANGVTINVPAGATALVNVSGASDRMQNFGFTIKGTDQQHVVYNFPFATNLLLTSIGVSGSILAPSAAINFSNGQINGTLIGASLTGYGEAHNYPFLGTLTSAPTVSLISLGVSPASVVGGSGATGTVTLSSAAPTNGAIVALSSSLGSATVPPTVTVAAGQTTGTFPVTTTSVSASVTTTISATYSGTTKTAPLTININPPAALVSLSASPSSVPGGTSSTGTVTLSGPAPAGGLIVTLSSSPTSAATVPASVTISANKTSATFPITTFAVAADTPVTLSGLLNGITVTAPLTVTAPVLTALSLNPTSVLGGTSSTGTVTVSSAAPTGGLAVTLSSSNAAAAPLASVTILAGQTSAAFTVTTSAVATSAAANITAKLNGTTKTALLMVNPPALLSFVVLPATVTGGQSSRGTVTLSGPAPAAGTVITLSSSSTSAGVPSSITVPAGAISVSFPVTTIAVSSTQVVTLSATLGSATLTTPLTITGVLELNLKLSPTSVLGGNTAQATVTLSSPAPAGGSLVILASDSAAAGVTVPAQVTVAAGKKTATFTVTTLAVGATVTANISASTPASSASAALSVTPPVLTGITLSPPSVSGGQYSTGTVTIGSPAPIGGLRIPLSSDNATATTQAFVFVPAGTTSSTFPVATSTVTVTATANISAIFGGVTKSAPLTITAAVSVLTSVVVTPGNAIVQIGATQQFTATALDQNGIALTTQPTFTWTVTSGGSIGSGTGLFTAGSGAGGPFTVTATTGTLSGTAAVTVETTGTTTTGLTPTATVKNTKWTIAGYGGMRGVGTGTIALAGVTGKVTQAYLYWHGPTNSSDPTANATVTFNSASITGTNIGFAASNCWPFSNSQAYRADVTALVSGNGNYPLANFVKAGGIDINGVALIVFYNDGTTTGNRDVLIFDGNDSNVDQKSDGNLEWNDTFKNINYTAGTAVNLWLGVSDGQSFPEGAVTINGSLLLPDGDNFDGNTVPYGSSFGPDNGGLWDIRSFNLTPFLTPGNNTLNLVSPFDDDCLSLIYAIVDQPTTGGGGGSSPGSPPTISITASASPNPVTGVTTNLSVLGADANGEVNLTYTWKTVGTPPSPVFLSLNGNNAAKNTVATFTQAGTYMFQVTVQNSSGLTVASFVTVTVNQTPSSLAITPMTVALPLNGTQQFTAVLTDQFGSALSSLPAVAWSVSSGVGSVSTNGLYTAGSAAGTATVQATAGALTATATVTVADTSPTITIAAAATPNPVNGTTTALSVLGASDAGESSLIYTWATTGTPPAAVSFSVNGTNAAKNCTATFTKAGSYTFQVVVRDTAGLTATSSVTVVVNQTLTTLTVSPATAALNSLATQQFTASAVNQFGAAISPLPAVTWTASGVGSISGSGLYTAPATAGAATITATIGSISGTASVTVSVSAPTITVAASANPNPVTGTTTALSVLGADASGESNLTYIWATTGTPPAAVTFSANGTNAAKNCTATFTKAGSYTLQVTVKNAGGATITSSVTVIVNQTPAQVSVTPPSAALIALAAQQFSATVLDQFSLPLATQPSVAWSVDSSGVGSISSTGLYTAGTTAGSATIRATSGGISGTASVTVSVSAPTITVAASANPNPVTGTTTALLVLGADASGESNLTYTWVTTGTPPAAVSFSVNGTNAAKNCTATFTKAGSYTLQVTAQNKSGLTATSTVAVVVNQTVTTVAVSPASVSVQTGTTRQFLASVLDQFGAALLTQPALTWTVSGVGSISTSGLFTAGSTTGAATVKAASGSISGTASVTVTAVVPVLTSIAVTPSPVSLNTGSTQQFVATALDQNGKPLTSQPVFTWSLASGTGTLSSTGFYTAPATAGSASVKAASGSLSGTASVTVTTASPPTIAVAASANPNPVTGTTTALSVLGADALGESSLTYTWATTGTPPAAVTFSANGTNAAKNCTATFTKAGSYTFQVTVKDAAGLTATSSVVVTVSQTLKTITVSPASATLNSLANQQFTAVAGDQFGTALSATPAFTWSVDSGGVGSISASGLYTAGSAAGTASVRATSGGQSGTASVTVSVAAPTITTSASANPNPVTAKTTALSVLGADASGESNLTYTWAVTGTPPAPVSFSINGTNAAKNCTATFTKAGSYTFQVTAKNAGGATATSSVAVVVSQTLTSIAVTPAAVTIQTSTSQQFQASAADQFGQSLATQPAFAWIVSGGGAIGGANGTFTAGNAAGGPYTVTASAGGVSGTASVTLVAAISIATPVISVSGGAGSAVVSVADGTPGAVLFYTLGTPPGTPTNASAPYQGPFVVTNTTTIAAVAYLSGSHSLVATATATVTNGAGPSVPSVAIASPQDGAVLTGGAVGSSPLIPILGSVSPASLSSWTLQYRPVSGDDGSGGSWIALSAGTTAQPGGSTLGALDPTLMLNGQYQIELTAYSTAGQSTSTYVTVLIKGDQKVGYFTLSYNDLTVPISGLPITITRTYDSRNKGLGDFGVGWTLSTTNVKVQKADTIGLDWTETISGANFGLVPNQSHLITITFPNGDTYNFVPYIAPQYGDSYDDTGGTINFAPVGPVQGATLISKNSPGGISFVALPISGGGNAVGVELDAVDGSDEDGGFPADDNEFILTLRNGKQFDVSIDGGLQSIRDLNGNTLTFTPNGIYSSNYSGSTPVVSYQRVNGNGLISQITGPSGVPLIYTQTGTDLTGFKDRAGNASTYDYDYAHDLTGIHDPRGIQPLRNDYDASGRLLDSVDADQNKIIYSYDLIGHKQTVFDRLGHETDFSYDSYGNVMSKTQHLIVGGVDTPIISKSAFGDSNNPDKKTMDTDPLGRVTTYGYLPTGELLTTTQQRLNGGQPVTTSYTYNGYGEPLTVQDANNQGTTNYATTSTYDANGNLKTTKDALGNTSQFFYNPNGTPDHTVDASSNTTYYAYAAGANYPAGAYVTGVKDALGHVTAFDYDADGNKTSQVQTRTNAANGADTLITHNQYDADDRLNTTIFPDSTTSTPDTVQTVYNTIGKVDHTVDPLGRTTYYKYDNQGRATETDYQDGTKTLTSYDLNGQRLTSTDRAGRITGNIYDTLGRLIQSGPINAAGNWLTDSGGNPIYSQTSYDVAGQTLTETDQNGNVTTYTYDDLGRKATVKDALSNVTVYNDASDSGYDLNGNQLKVKDARGNLTKFQYDLDNHLLETDLYKSDGVTLLTSTKTGYDVLGRRHTSTDGDSNTTTYNYDAVGRLASVLDARNKTTSYSYDEIGEKIGQTDANNHTTKFQYNLENQLVMKTLPVGQFETMTYNLDSTLATQTDYNGTTTSYTYEPNTGRLSYKVSSTGQWVGYDYYADGSRRDAYRGHGAVSFSAADSTLTNTYDALGRLQTVRTPVGLLAYGYDRAGNKTSLTSPSGTTTYDYDGDNRLWHVYHKTGGTTTYGYDANGNRQSLTLPTSTGIMTSYTYDEANRLTLLVNAKGGTTLSSYAYALYPSGRRQSVTDATGGKITYAYDADGRLTSEISTGLPPAIANSYGYDDVGNRISLNGGTAITYDADDRLTTPGHSYDADGNETTVNGQAATYDFENHLLTVGSVSSYSYDADGNRLSVTTASGTTSYLVDTSAAFARVQEEYSGGALAARYDYGDDLLRMDRTLPTVSTSYYLYDGLGSTRQLVNANGTVTDSYLYDAYGVGLLHSPSSGIVNPFLFQGQQFDAASLDYYQRARYYDPTTGRFLSQDPFSGNTNDPITLHRYLYAAGDPLDNIDPSGNEEFSIGAVAFSVSIGGLLGSLPSAHDAVTIGQLRDQYNLDFTSAGPNIFGVKFRVGLDIATAALGFGIASAQGPQQLGASIATAFVGACAAWAFDELTYILEGNTTLAKLKAKSDDKFDDRNLDVLDGFAGGALTGAIPGGPIAKILPGVVALGQDLYVAYFNNKPNGIKSTDIDIAIGDGLFQIAIAFALGQRNEALDGTLKALVENEETSELVADLARGSLPQVLGGAAKTLIGDETSSPTAEAGGTQE